MSYGDFKLNNSEINQRYYDRVGMGRTDFDVIKGAGRFFEHTKDENISDYERGKSLDQLVYELGCLQIVINNGLDSGDKGIKESLEKIITFRLTKAIAYKKKYYEDSVLGKIAKFFLKISGQWHNGNTPTIEKACRVRDLAFEASGINNPNDDAPDRVKSDRYYLRQALLADQIFDFDAVTDSNYQTIFPWERKTS